MSDRGSGDFARFLAEYQKGTTESETDDLTAADIEIRRLQLQVRYSVAQFCRIFLTLRRKSEML